VPAPDRAARSRCKARAARNGDKLGIWKVERDKLRELKAKVNDALRRQRDLLSRVI
jgi:hypothetical protein